ncbi:MAG: PRC-barrel domain-containing protein [Oscillospiraceae bacterium]|nr:PRC-barrel domain-containing protein [Oscillospiraceae bacterium]
MKSNKEIFGLSLFGIQDGLDCGKVVELIINIEEKSAEYVVLDNGRGVCGYKVLPFSEVTGIGKDIITTPISEECKLLWEDKEALSLSLTSVNLLGTSVFSNNGNVIGTVIEFFIDEDTGAIEKLILDNGGAIDGEEILTLSKDKVFTTGTVSAPPVPAAAPEPAPAPEPEPAPAAEITPPPAPAPASAPAPAAPAENKNAKPKAEPEPAQISIEPEVTDNKAKAEKGPAPAAGKPVADPSADPGANRLEHILGNEIMREVKDKTGAVLAKEGDIVTEELIIKVRDAGKLIELIQNVRK